MTKTTKTLCFILSAAFLAGGCAKQTTIDPTQANVDAFYSFARCNFQPAVDTTGFGGLILEDVPGSGAAVRDSAYLFIHYVARDMETGLIREYTSADIARQVGLYSPSSYYGPHVLHLLKGSTVSGIIDMVSGGKVLPRMKVGAARKGIIPFWLSASSWYGSKQEYISAVTGGSSYVYEIEIIDQTSDIKQWQCDTILRYIARRGLPAVKADDADIWYARVGDPSSEKEMPKDTSFYINYTGRLLGGQVFDTTIADTAKVWNIYDAASSYAPVQINANADSTAFTMTSSGSSVISGFSRTLARMHPFEKGVGIFTSDYGYAASGTGDVIPGFAPLVFEIEVVAKPQ